MRVLSRFLYQKLRQEVIFQEQDEEQHNTKNYQPRYEVVRKPSSSLIRRWFTSFRPRRIRLKFKLGGFRKRFKIRRVKVARFSWANYNKVVKRLKESQAHLGDLFAGNYLFMQVTPANYFNNKPYLTHHNHLHHNSNNSYALQKVG